MSVSINMVKELRERTAAGMMDCKKALQECNGDMDKAIDWLRQKGLSQVAKRATRAATEGRVSLRQSADGKVAMLTEVRCETDFVSRGEKFQAFADLLADTAFEKNPATPEELRALVEEQFQTLLAQTGENTIIGRIMRMELSQPGLIASYIHTNEKLGVLVELGCEKEETAAAEQFKELGKNIAMQVAAASPLSIDVSCLDPAAVEREREVLRQKTLEEGKPENMVDKIVDGRIKKFYQEVCLVDQAYIRDDKKTISQLLDEEGKALGDKISIRAFFRLQLGEE
ncbi:MAG: translation elongation factor Ts [Desulfovibrionaceae bacterium]|nr:translation elongation factor Ts [Desulfovibrionaceae bacterium]